ncbi:MAG: class II aldolase/adducin family protein [Thermoanaerobacterium sp.]|nr:class II aldolase/adducin family protein [Thermoanaerobacterium sp.]
MKKTTAIEQMIEATNLLLRTGSMFKGYHANLSARIDEEHIVMTKGGDVSNLNEDSFVVVHLDGTIEDGNIDATNAEVILMHTSVYKERRSVGSVIHTHAPNATAFAIAHQPIPLVYEPLLRFNITEPIPVIDWAPRGSEASVNQIIDTIKKHSGISAVLLANHGVLTFSSDPLNTARLLVAIDEAAELVLKAKQLGGEKELPQEAVKQVQDRMKEFARN